LREEPIARVSREAAAAGSRFLKAMDRHLDPTSGSLAYMRALRRAASRFPVSSPIHVRRDPEQGDVYILDFDDMMFGRRPSLSVTADPDRPAQLLWRGYEDDPALEAELSGRY
jgi:hypothetical protein